MERREFCWHGCQAATLAALGLFADACGNPTSPSGNLSASLLTVVSGTNAGNTVTVNIASAPALAAVGGAALIDAPSGKFLAFRTAQDTFSAMTAICTHEGCTVTRFASPNFVCECHGSEYNSTGGVVKGPASRALQRFTASFANSVLTITT